MPLIPFPNVPNVPGVPSIPRQAFNSFGGIINLAASAGGALLFFKSLTSLRIGLYEKDTGLSVPEFDGSTIEFNVNGESVVPSYPVEGGSWMNYNVVVLPIKITAKILYAPTFKLNNPLNNPKLLQAKVLDKFNSLRENPTPLLWYDGNDFLGDFQLTKFSTAIDNKFGPTAIIIDIELTEILTVTSVTGTQLITENPKNPYNTSIQDGGLIQTVPKTTAQVNQITGVVK